MTMTKIKIANWNIEWMNRWFTDDKDEPPAIKTQIVVKNCEKFAVDQLAQRVAKVISSLEADILTLQEGPSRKSEMALFIKNYLQNGFDIVGPAGKRQQRLYVLFNKKSNVVVNKLRLEQDLLMLAQYCVGAQGAATVSVRHSLCPKTTLYSAGINRVRF